MTIAPAEIGAHWFPALLVAGAPRRRQDARISIAAFLTGNGPPPRRAGRPELSQIGEFAFIVVAVGSRTGSSAGFVLPVVVGASAITAITGGVADPRGRIGSRAGSVRTAQADADVRVVLRVVDRATLHKTPPTDSICGACAGR